jgi:hypothetical protein
LYLTKGSTNWILSTDFPRILYMCDQKVDTMAHAEGWQWQV